MRFLLFIVLLGAMLITAGCTGGDQNSVVTPTPQIADVTILETSTPIPTITTVQDRIIGTWHWTMPDRSKTIFYSFTLEGSYLSSDSNNEGTDSGTWIKYGENQYNVTLKNGNTILFVYQTATNSIAKINSPDMRFYPPGEGSVILTYQPHQTPSQSSSTLSIETPIPTLNKNSVAYQNYKDDLREIDDIETDLKILQSNYISDMQHAGQDVAWARSLTIEYKKDKAAYEIRLKAAQTRAAADLAEANGE
jgi:hypothetical protein